MNRNLVLLLSSGHTVKIGLRDNDLAGNGGPTSDEVRKFLLGLPAVVSGKLPDWTFAYIEDMTSPGVDDEPTELQRIDAYSPGENL